MTKNLFLLCLSVILVFVATNCGNTPTGGGVDTPGVEKTLFDTKWDFMGFFDIENDMLVEPVRSDTGFDAYGNVTVWHCEVCFTLAFNIDGTVSAKGLRMWRGSDSYSVNYALSTIQIERLYSMLPMNDNRSGEEYFYYVGISKTFELTDSELKLYYEDYNTGRTNYLLFRRGQ